MGRLIQCKDCGNNISKSAKVCPHCGKKQFVSTTTIIFIIIPLILIAAYFLSRDTTGNASKEYINKETVKVENIRVEKEFPNAWTVKGDIRNISSNNTKGYVKIKFINSNGDIKQSYSAKVNDGDELQPGKSGPFSYTTLPSDFNNITDFEVVFIPK